MSAVSLDPPSPPPTQRGLSEPLGANTSSQTAKRVSVACEACRARKVRCDAVKPQCGPCGRNALACDYAVEHKKRGRPRGAKNKLPRGGTAASAASSSPLMGTGAAAMLSATTSSLEDQSGAVGSGGDGGIVEMLRQTLGGQVDIAGAMGGSVAPFHEERTSSSLAWTFLSSPAPRTLVLELIDLFFRKVAPLYPVLWETQLREDFDSGREEEDLPFRHLLMALCAATAVCLHAEPMTPLLSQQFSSWEDAARTFNNAFRPRSLRETFLDRASSLEKNVIVLQTLVLVLLYELALGSNEGFHLAHEGFRFCFAYGFHREGTEGHSATSELQKRVLWLFFGWDKIASLYSRAPICMRSDEFDTAVLDHPVAGLPSSAEYSLSPPESHESVAYFAALVGLSRLLERVLLQHRLDVRAVEKGESVQSSFNAQITDIMAASVDLGGATALDALEADTKLAQTVTLSVFKLSICLETYCRYASLLSGDASVYVVAIESIARDLLQSAQSVPPRILDRTGPLVIDMTKRAHGLLTDLVPALQCADPFSCGRAAQCIGAFSAFTAQIDRLRITARADHPAEPLLPEAPLASHYLHTPTDALNVLGPRLPGAHATAVSSGAAPGRHTPPAGAVPAVAPYPELEALIQSLILPETGHDSSWPTFFSFGLTN